MDWTVIRFILLLYFITLVIADDDENLEGKHLTVVVGDVSKYIKNCQV